MSLTFRTVAIAILVIGFALGISFGAGIAYGRGDPKTVQSGLTQQQIQQLIGGTGAGAGQFGAGAGAASPGAGAGAAGGAQGAGGGGAQASLLGANATAGRVTAIQGQTVSIETRQGTQRVNLSSSTTVSRLAAALPSDIKEGMTIIANGTRKDDGSFDATSLAQVPQELQGLVTGTGATQARGTPTPTPRP
jgi:hypothetical protein